MSNHRLKETEHPVVTKLPPLSERQRERLEFLDKLAREDARKLGRMLLSDIRLKKESAK